MLMTGCSTPSSPSSDAGADAAACGPAVQDCPCCSAIAIKKLAFTGNNVIDKDTDGRFAREFGGVAGVLQFDWEFEWLDGRDQAEQMPVSYARNRKVSFYAAFRVTTAACRSDETIQVKANATFGSASLEWNATVTVNPGDSEVNAMLSSNNPLPDEIGIFESSDIVWQMNPCNAGWRPAGVTRNVVYVTLSDPADSPNYWTLLDISCRAAAGISNENDFVKASFVPFRSTVGDGKGFKRKRDGKELTYYKFGAGTSSSGVYDCRDLLSRDDATGRCGAWASFLVAMHHVHGVTSSVHFGVRPVGAPLLIVRKCTFKGAGSLPVPYTHAGIKECSKEDGIFGQGKNNPQFTFDNHALVSHATGIYDPSYGVGPIPDLPTWETGGIAGVGEFPPLKFTYGGDPHYIPARCSPGFRVHVAETGDTVASIASKFGIASATALYSHRYNSRYRAAYSPPGGIFPGDWIIIPRDISNKGILEKY